MYCTQDHRQIGGEKFQDKKKFKAKKTSNNFNTDGNSDDGQSSNQLDYSKSILSLVVKIYFCRTCEVD